MDGKVYSFFLSHLVDYWLSVYTCSGVSLFISSCEFQFLSSTHMQAPTKAIPQENQCNLTLAVTLLNEQHIVCLNNGWLTVKPSNSSLMAYQGSV